jgi:hypothetical protein
MNARRNVLLEFHPERDDVGPGKRLRDGLSVAVQIGETLWVTNDETSSLERLSLVKGGDNGPYRYGRDHTPFSLQDYLRLPVPPRDPKDVDEADVEGLAYDDGYLWLVGSHSLTREQPKPTDGPKKARRRLARVRRDGNRHLLARIPVDARHGTYTLVQETTQHGHRRTVAQLRGDDQGNDLTEALGTDEHLGGFLTIPGKDNGFDIEGLAAAGGRLFLGLRGPVLRGWAVILEVAPREARRRRSTLRLTPIGPKGRPYRKHFLDLGGLGVRDLCVQGADLLILAGPTMDLDGPAAVFRWPGGRDPDGEAVVPASLVERVLDVPTGRGVDRAEGMTVFAPDGGAATALLVVYDAASRRRRVGKHTVAADVFPLPRASDASQV